MRYSRRRHYPRDDVSPPSSQMPFPPLTVTSQKLPNRCIRVSIYADARNTHISPVTAEAAAPLLNPEEEASTKLQATTLKKLHTYLLLRALSRGYLPSTAQATAHLQHLLASPLLHPQNIHLTPSGRRLIRDLRRLLQLLITVLEKKNGQDQLQDFLYFTRRARVGLDGGELLGAAGAATGGIAGATADISIGAEALNTVFSLLMQNREFKRLIQDAAIISRQVLADTAVVGGEVVKTAGEVVRPGSAELELMNDTTPVDSEEPGGYEAADGESGKVAEEVGEVLLDGLEQTAEAAVESVKEQLENEGKGNVLLERMKSVVIGLRGRVDYAQSVNIVAILLKRYALVYSRSLEKAAGAAAVAVETNTELDIAVSKFWKLVTSFGERADTFERLMDEIGTAIQELFMDPSFLDPAVIEEKLNRIRALIRGIGTGSTASEDLDLLLTQAERVISSVLNDTDISAVSKTSKAIIRNIWPSTGTLNPALVSDFTHVLLPLTLQLIQYIPLIRLTVSTPGLDLLIENLILEPGDTINHSSFFPHCLRLETHADFELRKGLHRYASETSSFATVKISGITVKAEEVGYWLKAHQGIWRFTDEGIVSFMLDKKGVDVALDLEFGREHIENLVALRSAKVDIHKLDFQLRRSRFKWLAWPLKPFIRLILKRLIKKQIEQQLKDAAGFVNRELLFARERLRATRIAKPSSVWTFIKAVSARLAPAESEDVEVGLGVRSGKSEGVFEGRYAPGSVVKVLEEQGEMVPEVVEEEAEGGWRNAVFDRVV
ncbi:hypothetical protein FPQ18DRAFT_422224 [Pyronema domesticum]|nr:hypothetical protein FPQ18DRAFT_422224 [Pyronema domesticum]